MVISLLSALSGYILDLIIGDPHRLWHSVQGIGSLITFFERFYRKIFSKTKKGEITAGIFMSLTVIIISGAVPLIILKAAYSVNTWFGFAVESVMCCQIFAARSLKDESMKVYRELKHGDLNSSRKAVSMIVGRDTQNLDRKGVIKAAVETVAENASDGVIAPMLYVFLGGAVGGFVYKAVNTMDSMVGYKNDKYLYFGRFSAKFDDLLNYFPSRIAALAMIVSAFCLRMDYRNSYRIFRRDRFNHSSPNSAQTESAVSGALGIQLAGNAYYFGKLCVKKTIGDDLREPEAEDIKKANKLMYIASLIILVISACIKYLIILLIES